MRGLRTDANPVRAGRIRAAWVTIEVSRKDCALSFRIVVLDQVLETTERAWCFLATQRVSATRRPRTHHDTFDYIREAPKPETTISLGGMDVGLSRGLGMNGIRPLSLYTLCFVFISFS
jgi:hypothetical protein